MLAGRTTIKDIARLSGVGVSTVSRVLNRHPDVSRATERKVMRMVKQLRFRPHSGARQLVRARAETICFVMSNRDVMSPFHSQVLIGVEQSAREASHNVIFLRFDYDLQARSDRLALPPVIWERGAVDGLIIAGTNYPNFIADVRSLGIPFVLFRNNLVGPVDLSSIDTVAFDSLGGTREATEYLIRLGHRNIAFVGAPELPWYGRCQEGYAAAMAAAKLRRDVHAARVDKQFTPFKAGGDAVGRMMASGHLPTAIVAGDDEIAMGVLSELQRAGLQVPAEVSLVGFDDLPAAAQVHPALTTIRVPRHELGRRLAAALFQRIDTPRRAASAQVVPTELVVRNPARHPRTSLCQRWREAPPSRSAPYVDRNEFA